MNNDLALQVRDDFVESERWGDGQSVVDLRAMALGRMPASVRASLSRFADNWQGQNLASWWTPGIDWWHMPEQIGDEHISKLLNAPEGSCIMVPSVTHVLQQLLSSREVVNDERRRVVTTNLEYPTVYDVLNNFNHREGRGLDFEVVEMGEGLLDADAIIDQIDEKTGLVFLTHVASFTGQMFSQEGLAKIAKAARAKGALLAVDGSQAITSARLDVGEMDADIYVGTLYKQGCGGPGNSYVYVKPGTELTPTLGGWVGVKEPFTHGGTVYREPAISVPRRIFGVGTPAISNLAHAADGLQIFERIGHEALVEDVRAKARYMIDRFRDAGLPLISPDDPQIASNLIALEVSDAARFIAELEAEEGVRIVGQEDISRMAPHVYHTCEEIQRATDAIINNLK